MKGHNALLVSVLCGSLTMGLNSCGLAQWAVLSDPNTDNTTRGTVVGATSGANLGSWVGAVTGHGYNNGDRAIVGGAIGAVVGGLAGAAIGNSMDQPKKAAKQQQQQQGYAASPADDELYYDQPEQQRLYPEQQDNSLHFGERSYNLSGSAKRQLASVAQRLKADPSAVAEVYGHTDNHGDRSQLKRISTMRAQVVRDYLMSQGVPGNQIYVKGCADQYPVASNSNSAGRARNRRVEVRVTHQQRAAAAPAVQQPAVGTGYRYEVAGELPQGQQQSHPAASGSTLSTVGDGAPSSTPLPEEEQ